MFHPSVIILDTGGSHHARWNLAFSVCHPAFPRQYVNRVLNDINWDVARVPYAFMVFFNSYVERHRDQLALYGFDYKYVDFPSLLASYYFSAQRFRDKVRGIFQREKLL